MHITIENFRDQFNVGLSSAGGKEPFLVVKGCRIKDGSKGRFISWPATKNGDKWWNHCWGSDAFQAAVIQAYDASAPKQQTRSRAQDDDAPPF